MQEHEKTASESKKEEVKDSTITAELAFATDEAPDEEGGGEGSKSTAEVERGKKGFLSRLFGKRRGEDATPAESDEATQGNAAKAGGLGLKWEEVDVEPEGSQISNEALAAALVDTNEFTQEELDAFEVTGLSPDSYIVVGDTFFKPCGTGQDQGAEEGGEVDAADDEEEELPAEEEQTAVQPEMKHKLKWVRRGGEKFEGKKLRELTH